MKNDKNLITIVDIGARGGLGREWENIPHKAILFEPDPEAKFEDKENSLIIRSALSDKIGRRTLYITKKGSNSSFHKPNPDLINLYSKPERYDVVKEISMNTETLDSGLLKHEVKSVDFIKLDVQGHELAILKGAVETLKNAVAVEVEVEFRPIYEDVPLFDEVDKYLRLQGFELVKFLNLENWKFGGREALIGGQAFYTKSFEDLDFEKREKLGIIKGAVLSKKWEMPKKNIKTRIKSILTQLGLYNLELHKKISGREKVALILQNKAPSISIFVETGTNEGVTMESVKNHFNKNYSIEFDRDLFEKVKEKFAGNENIELLCGDSAKEIKKVMVKLSEQALFWLDAHASGTITATNSPIKGELEAIFSHHVKNHTILIDDARHFDRKTRGMIRKMAEENNYKFDVKDGIFRLYGEC